MSHGDDAHNSGHSRYESLNDAQAERALELARKGDKMSDAELQEFNRLMRFNGREKDGEFATEFYKGLGGPEKALEFYAEMSIDGTNPDASKVRLNAMKDLQQNMGFALANATDPDTKSHLPASWGDDFRRLGTQQIGWEKGQWKKPYGYQVLGGLLRYGNYDPGSSTRSPSTSPNCTRRTRTSSSTTRPWARRTSTGSIRRAGWAPATTRSTACWKRSGTALRPRKSSSRSRRPRTTRTARRRAAARGSRRISTCSRTRTSTGRSTHQRHEHPRRRGQDEERAHLRPRSTRARAGVGDDRATVRRRHRRRHQALGGPGAVGQ